MPRSRATDIPKHVRAFAFGLMMGVGGVSYTYREISAMLLDKFKITIAMNTLKNWKVKKEEHVLKYGLTESYIREVIAKGVAGHYNDNEGLKLPLESDHNGAPKVQTEPKVTPKGTDESTPEPKVPLTFDNTAEIIAYCEAQGFFVAKSMSDIIAQLEQKNLQVVDGKNSVIGIENLFIHPITLDIEVVGRNIVMNPILQLYFAIERREKPDIDMTAWITACVIDVYNNLENPIRLAVITG